MMEGTPFGSSVTSGASGSALAPSTRQPSCTASPRVVGMLSQLNTSNASAAPALALLTTALDKHTHGLFHHEPLAMSSNVTIMQRRAT